MIVFNFIIVEKIIYALFELTSHVSRLYINQSSKLTITSTIYYKYEINKIIIGVRLGLKIVFTLGLQM